ncbi:glycine cleavage system protein GcvH [Sciscionella sediminilitoris]|uniref:glycine cleavage system protein GcvH n=1 Tax=Sciscionella sediminilitoris TaxID=1445613 RepID=UPI0004DF5FF1|nr:glycine cleavage system protein GcvH [Sciscionella sp. SE31]
MTIPNELRYSKEHEWIAVDGDVATVGITAFAAEALGDVVFVQLPAVGENIGKGDAIGEVESTKSVSDVYSPLSGEITEVNGATETNPETVNEAPYESGWLFKLRLSDTGELDALLDAGAYAELIKEA